MSETILRQSWLYVILHSTMQQYQEVLGGIAADAIVYLMQRMEKRKNRIWKHLNIFKIKYIRFLLWTYIKSS